jgi:hypothetical protein
MVQQLAELIQHGDQESDIKAQKSVSSQAKPNNPHAVHKGQLLKKTVGRNNPVISGNTQHHC